MVWCFFCWILGIIVICADVDGLSSSWFPLVDEQHQLKTKEMNHHMILGIGFPSSIRSSICGLTC